MCCVILQPLTNSNTLYHANAPTKTNIINHQRVYLQQYGELLEKHYRRTVLDHLPKEAWKKLDEPEMIDSPNLEQFVFCRVLDETVSIDVSGETSALNDDLADNDEDDYAGDNIQDHAGGSYLIVMYKQVKDLVLEGKVELLM